MSSGSLPRVIFVNRVYWPSQAATAQLLADLAEALAARGWPVHVVAAGEGAAGRNGVTIHRTGQGDVHGGLLSRADNYRRFLSAARRKLRELTRPGDIVVLKTDPPLLATVATGPALRRGGRVLHWLQDVYPEIIPQHSGAWAVPLLWPLRFARDRAWRQASRCLPVSADMGGLVAERGVEPSRIAVMPNWAPPELERPPRPEEVAMQRKAWGLDGKFVAAYSGNLGRVHEFATLLDAAACLRGEPDMVFLFIGNGARFEEVKRSAAARGLANVRFLPAQPRDTLAVTLAAADVHFVTLKPGFERLVHPSKLAGILAAGRPVVFVGPAASGITALLRDGGCGASFEPASGDGVAETLRRWRGDQQELARMGAAARECHQRHFAFGTAVTHWEALLRDVAGETRQT